MQKFFQKYWPGLALTAIILVFFSKLFFPPSIFITPDYGRSDLLHFNIPVRTFSQEALKNWRLPLWEPTLGQGFPLLEEGQIGFFYIPNIILFGIFPFWLAFNLSFVATFIIAAFGTYFLARSFGINKKGSYLAAITFAFSPIFVLQIIHLNLIQAASILPWLFLLINSFFKSGNRFFLLLFAFFSSQQIFTGFTQLFLYSQVGALTFFLFNLKTAKLPKTQKIKTLIFFIFAITLSLALAAIQILATYNLAKQADRINEVNPQKILLDFPYQPKNLATVIDPYILGNIKDGTYPHWQAGKWGIFWESNSYFGIVQLIIASGFLLSQLIKPRENKSLKIIIFFSSLGFLAILLALGASAPLHPVFSLPPFSFFRVPARFLLLFFLSAAIIAGFAVSKINSRKALGAFIAFALIAAATGDIFRVWYNYHAIGQKKDWLSQPPLAAPISSLRETSSLIDKNYRVVNYGQNQAWNEVFIKNGWNGQEQSYQFFRNFLAQNQNSDSNIPNLLVYAGMYPKRTKHLATFAFLDTKNENGILKIGPISQKVLDFSSTLWMTTPYPIDSTSWQKISQVEKDNKIIYLYKNRHVMPHAFTVGNYQTAKTVQDVIRILQSEQFDPRESVILEKNVELAKGESQEENKVEIKNYQKTKVEISVDAKQETLLVLSDSFYPGWEARIDGKKTEILAANINSRAVLVPAGNHLITFSYKPKLVFWGLAITLIAHLAFIAFLAKRLLNRHAKLPLS